LPKTSTAFKEGHTKMALQKKALHEKAPIKMALQKKPPFIWNLFKTYHQCSGYNNKFVVKVCCQKHQQLSKKGILKWHSMKRH